MEHGFLPVSVFYPPCRGGLGGGGPGEGGATERRVPWERRGPQWQREHSSPTPGGSSGRDTPSSSMLPHSHPQKRRGTSVRASPERVLKSTPSRPDVGSLEQRTTAEQRRQQARRQSPFACLEPQRRESRPSCGRQCRLERSFVLTILRGPWPPRALIRPLLWISPSEARLPVQNMQIRGHVFMVRLCL